MTSDKRYDNVRIVNPVDGTVIEGHDAVQAHFEREKRLTDEHGATIRVQVYRVDLHATTIEQFQGALLAELTIDGASVSGADTVAQVKELILTLIRERSATTPGLVLGENDGLTLLLGGRPLREDALFYTDNFILLPVWIQGGLHACDPKTFLARLAEVLKNRAGTNPRS